MPRRSSNCPRSRFSAAFARPPPDPGAAITSSAFSCLRRRHAGSGSCCPAPTLSNAAEHRIWRHVWSTVAEQECRVMFHASHDGSRLRTAAGLRQVVVVLALMLVAWFLLMYITAARGGTRSAVFSFDLAGPKLHIVLII